MNKKFVFGILAASALVGPAMGADLGIVYGGENAGYTASGYDWTGFYAGVNGGYASGEAVTANLGSIKETGGLLGGQLGYNVEFGGFVLGAEADIQWSGLEGSLVAPLGTVISGGVDYFGTVRIRAGAAFDGIMPYVTAGWAYGAVSAHSTFAGGFSDTKAVNGYTVGGGVEAALTDNISVKAEYLYTNFGSPTLFSGTIVEQEVGMSFHTIRAGVNFKF